MTDDQLLVWLAESDFSQYGECHGRNLDSLIAKGFVKIHEGRECQSGFIAQGDSLMYRAVSLTETGIAAAAKARAADRSGK